MKNKKSFKEIYPVIIIAVALVIGIYLFFKEAIIIGHHTYGNVEQYEFNIGSDELESEIDTFKKNNPDLNPPADDPIFGSLNNDSLHHYIYYLPIHFYYSDKQSILITLLMPIDKNHTFLGFYKIVDQEDRYKTSGKEINYSLGCSDNRKQLKLFEERIVNPLHKQIREKYKHLKQKK